MEIDTTRRFINHFLRNLAANIAYFLVNIIIEILLVPFFIAILGVAAYSLIPLAASVTGYVAIVVQSLNTAVTRFLTVDLQQEDYAATMVFKAFYNSNNKGALKRVKYHSNGLTVTPPDTKYSTDSIVVIRREVQKIFSGVA